MILDLTYTEKQSELFFPEHFPKYTVVPKGRRAGLTRGAAHAFIEYGLDEDFSFLPKGDLYFLWGDTVSTNIDRYYERYFLPALKGVPGFCWKWRAQDRILRIGRLTVDFRSADRPENWEGFGYHVIFLNEAGIILEDDYLFDNAVLPMLMDFPNAKLIAAGVPKGKRHKNGEHKYYKLYKDALAETQNHRIIRMTGRDNPFIAREEIDSIASNMDSLTRLQEIDGEFIDINQKKFLYTFSEDKNVIDSYEVNPNIPILVSFDFNVEPMTATIGQKLTNRRGIIFDFIKILVGSTEEVCEELQVKYPNYWIEVTGDATGHNREKARKGNITSYKVIRKMLSLRDNDLKVPAGNMAHKDSRQLCCSVCQHAEFLITRKCQEVINDCLDAGVDDKGELIKTKEQGRHFFDNVRYTIHTWYPDFISAPHRYQR
jgi:hypothetical protein